MANNNRDWEDLGRTIQDIVDQAVNSHDYQKLNQTIRQAVNRAVDMGSEAVRKAVDGTGRAAQPSREERQAAEPVRDIAALYGNTRSKTVEGIAKVAVGGVLSCVTIPMFLVFCIRDAVFTGAGLLSGSVLLSLASVALSLWPVCSGASVLGMVKRFKTYRKTLGDRTHCTLEKLARSVGKNVKFVRKELQNMISQGLFLEGHLDKEQTSLITSDETYRYYEQSRLQLEERQRQEAAASRKQADTATHSTQVREVLDRGNAFITEIRRCNDAIPGAEISAKIDRMEMLVRRIFQRVETNPEIVSDLKKMMDYYLPMTVKLLNAYADMDAQPVQGETILNSKREIEATLDTLNLAFEKLLDSVFADTALDISSDISVLNTLLAQEGLAEDDLSKMKKQRNL